MGLLSFFKTDKVLLQEALPSFRNKGKDGKTDAFMRNTSGEGFDRHALVSGYGKSSLHSFNNFYRSYINIEFQNRVQRIMYYRAMASNPEISAVLEDIVTESTMVDHEGNVISLKVVDKDLEANQNIQKNLTDEFSDLFYRKFDINTFFEKVIQQFYIDGEVFYERINNKNKPSQGLVKLKILPTETMEAIKDPVTGKVEAYFQYIEKKPKKPVTIEEALDDDKIIVFWPSQISHIEYATYNNQTIGYLEKSKQPFNQLKLLETSVVIYRLVRAPERLVFRIDTGSMPRDKAMKFVEKIKQKLTTKVSYDSSTGGLHNQPDVMSMLDNYFLPQSADGRGSSIESVGGNPSGFAEIDDIWYFARKLYTSLRYPMSRVANMQEGRSSDNLFMNGQSSEINRDEIRWARFLEGNQSKFTEDFLNVFLLHMEFKGLKKEYELDESKITIIATPPNSYKDQIEQALLEMQMNNYQNFANNSEFSKSFLMQRYLDFTEEDLKVNGEGFILDKKYLPQDEGY